jgi:DNA-directed RNA polymerase subunit RPC12/RpoP
MRVEEMFPTKPEQIMVQRIIEVLQKYPDSNIIEIGKHLWLKDTVTPNLMLYQAMKNLQSLNIVSCRIKRTNMSEEMFRIDYFTLTSKAEEDLIKLRSLHKAPPYKPRDSRGPRYIVFLCGKCGAAVGARSSQKSASCTRCNYKNLIDEKLKVLLKTDNAYEMQSTIQMAKLKGSPKVNNRPPFAPEKLKKPKS